ncbi:DNA topoisomerase III [uncultured Paraglaciecola sp.]|uniref:DNA topoisomerase III n=1 Tax=uncultured Paraglaciecola sp. TaxID=1765024 RepID=UPI0025F3CE08|nr:DNA topoisomerase III [uncultured Paraglaciecola sp.]
MRLFIAEKPSLGRAIAEVLPKPHKKGDGYISAANGDTVSWCIGHLLEQQQPEAYDPAFKKWSHEHLPIIPQQWQLGVKKQTAKQLGVLRKLVKQADQLVHAGDPDREGQLLVDEVINFFGVTGTKKSTIQRCLISDLNPSAVKQSLNNLRSNREFIPLSTSALARSRADWLYGINLTRAYTLQGQKAGYNGVLSVGRVQTPLLGLVVRRDKAIADFVSKAFYEVWASLETDQGQGFKAKWQPSEQCAKFLDEQGRNLSQALAQNVVKRVSGQPAQVKNLKREHKKQAPPLPYNLSSLQIDASKAFGMSAQQVLDICQGLYERHKLITYPRSDCRYLPMSHFVQAKEVHAAVMANSQHLGQQGKLLSQTQIDFSRKSKAWNDKKVDAHHGIIPTQKVSNNLSGNDAKVYGLICRNYVAQFLAQHELYAVRVDVEIASGLFVAVAKELIAQGWKCIFVRPVKNSNQDNNNQYNNSEVQQMLPSLENGQMLKSLQAEVLEKNTSPPKAYTDATLLAAMTGISSHVNDPQLRKILRETDGLGTEATRAGIIELLFSRGFLSRSGKTITSTVTGRGLVEALPDVATYPDMTARWEAELSAISEGRSLYKKLMGPLEAQLKDLVTQSLSVLPQGLSGLGKKSFAKKRKGNSKRKFSLKQQTS